jgi:hypothetical protein
MTFILLYSYKSNLIVKQMKKHKIIFWVTTTIIFLMEGVMPALFSGSEDAKKGIEHLGYPEYFGYVLAVFKVLGTLALMIPLIPKRIKEWAYAGFIFDFLFASISYLIVDGPGFFAFFPLIFLVILALSYNSYLKLNP